MEEQYVNKLAPSRTGRSGLHLLSSLKGVLFDLGQRRDGIEWVLELLLRRNRTAGSSEADATVMGREFAAFDVRSVECTKAALASIEQ